MSQLVPQVVQDRVFWRGNKFWMQIEDDSGCFDKLQSSLSRSDIFQSGNALDISPRWGDIIPVPDLPLEALSTDALDGNDTRTKGCDVALKSVTELLSLELCPPPPASPRTLIDQRIEELAQSSFLDGASRLAASPKILANLRPIPPPKTSSLLNEIGISRLPSESAKRIAGMVDNREDLSALSRVSRRWRSEAQPVLYSTLALRGWDEVILCLRSVCSGKNIARYVIDLTVDVAQLPDSLEPLFFEILGRALDITRNLRRLVLLIPRFKTLEHQVARTLAPSRFRLHHFVYDGCSNPNCLNEFLDYQSSIRTLQISCDAFSSHEPLILPCYITQLWMPKYDPVRPLPLDVSHNLKRLSHLSIRCDSLPIGQQGDWESVHYLACDISPVIASGIALSLSTQAYIVNSFSRIRILRLVGYWIVCETPALGVTMQEEFPIPHHPFMPDPAEDPRSIQKIPNNVGSFISWAPDFEMPHGMTTTLRIEPAFLKMLSELQHLQALEVGSFAVRDAGRMKDTMGSGNYWLSQRVHWEEEFVHRISLVATKLVVVSFLACDETLYRSTLPSPAHICSWSRCLQRAKETIALDARASGITIPGLIARAGIPQWTPPSVPDNRCSYQMYSSFEASNNSRKLLEDVVTNEYIKDGPKGTWSRRVNVRNLRDIWPVGC